MTTDVSLFEGAVPTYLTQQTEADKILAKQIGGGLDGAGSINKISLRNSKFRFNKGGVEVGMVPGALDVIVVAANPHVGRVFYAKAYNPDDQGARPDCYSLDGETPEDDSPEIQHSKCATCPQNVKGSSRNGEGKACAYKKRLIVVDPAAINGDKYALDMGAMSMFGTDAPSQKQYNLRSYLEQLKVAGLHPAKVVTRFMFDDKASVAKLFLQPVRPLSQSEWTQVQGLVGNPEIARMLQDTVESLPQTNGAAPPVPAVPVAGSIPQVAAAPVPAKPGRPRANKAQAQAAQAAAPAPAPAPTGFPTAAAAPAATPTGFPVGDAAQAAPGQAAFSIDVEDFDD